MLHVYVGEYIKKLGGGGAMFFFLQERYESGSQGGSRDQPNQMAAVCLARVHLASTISNHHAPLWAPLLVMFLGLSICFL